MPWTTTVSLDAWSNDVGTISATWTEKEGTPPAVFTYSSRAKRDAAGLNAFVAVAITARDAWQAKTAANIAAAAALAAKFNAVDPQAGG